MFLAKKIIITRLHNEERAQNLLEHALSREMEAKDCYHTGLYRAPFFGEGVICGPRLFFESILCKGRDMVKNRPDSKRGVGPNFADCSWN